jgi:hypothetical protein
VHRQSLAGAVLTKHGQQFAMVDVEFERINQVAVRNVDAQLVAGKQCVAGLAHKRSLAYSGG